MISAGVILMVVGAIGLVLYWSSWHGFGSRSTAQHTTVVDDGGRSTTVARRSWTTGRPPKRDRTLDFRVHDRPTDNPRTERTYMLALTGYFGRGLRR